MDYRNKGIFIYIAKRLQALGVYRDWQQCRVQDKNLKHEYRTVTCALSSGDSSKTMEFFHDLNGILQCEPAIQLKGRCEWQMPGNDEPKSSPRNDWRYRTWRKRARTLRPTGSAGLHGGRNAETSTATKDGLKWKPFNENSLWYVVMSYAGIFPGKGKFLP